MPRLRIFCTLQLYWDRIVLATCDDDGERRISSLEPATARLWRRGFSEEIPTGKTGSPLRFEWERVSEVPRWSPHPGRYTRLGEWLPLRRGRALPGRRGARGVAPRVEHPRAAGLVAVARAGALSWSFAAAAQWPPPAPLFFFGRSWSGNSSSSLARSRAPIICRAVTVWPKARRGCTTQ